MDAMTGNDAEKIKKARIKTIVLLLGVGLALATFMVKDQKRDDLKEKLQEIENQESIFERESYLRSTPVILASIQKSIAEVGRAIDDLSRVKRVESESRHLAGFYFVFNEALQAAPCTSTQGGFSWLSHRFRRSLSSSVLARIRLTRPPEAGKMNRATQLSASSKRIAVSAGSSAESSSRFAGIK
jgi:hypothetical protein